MLLLEHKIDSSPSPFFASNVVKSHSFSCFEALKRWHLLRFIAEYRWKWLSDIWWVTWQCYCSWRSVVEQKQRRSRRSWFTGSRRKRRRSEFLKPEMLRSGRGRKAASTTRFCSIVISRSRRWRLDRSFRCFFLLKEVQRCRLEMTLAGIRNLSFFFFIKKRKIFLMSKYTKFTKFRRILTNFRC